MTVSDEYKGIEGMSSAQRTYARLLRGPCGTHTVLHSLRFRARTQENIGNPIPITLDTTIQNTDYTKILHFRRPEVVHWIAIFFGASSGVVRGKVTVKTPSVIDALISSGCEQLVSTQASLEEEQTVNLP